MNNFPRRKIVNPNHHNFGRSQSAKGRFAARLTWLKFQLLATYGNVLSARTQVEKEFRTAPAMKTAHQLRIQEVLTEARTIAMRAKALSDEIAELNSPDKWAE